MRKIIILSLFILQTFLITTLAQNTDQPKDELGCATEQAKQLKFLQGKWNVINRFRTSGQDNKWEETKAKSEIKFLFKDCLWLEELEGTREGRPHEVIGMYSYNNINDKLQWVGGHSEHGVLSLYEGNFEGDDLNMFSSLEIRGRKILFRRQITKTAKGFEVRSQRSVDDGKTWDTSWHLTYTRR